jgi:hypothetical protein
VTAEPTTELTRAKAPTGSPSMRQLNVYEGVLVLARAHGRHLNVQELYPLLKDFTRLRNTERLWTPADGPRKDCPANLALPQQVMRVWRNLQRCVTQYLGDTDRIKSLKAEVADNALQTLRECLTAQGAFDADPKLLKAKAETAQEVLRICGLSQEQVGQTNILVQQGFGQSIPAGESAEAERLRRELYDERMGQRSAGAVIVVKPAGPAT